MTQTRTANVTLQDIAAKVGVSRDTVSRILNRGATYEKPALAKRAQKIRNVARELGYRPNTAARAARSGKFQRVGLILPYGRASYIPHGFVSGMTHALAENGYQLAIGELPPAEESTSDLPHLLTELSLDGIVNFAPEITEPVRHDLANLGLPTMWINEKRDCNAVYPDEFGAAERLTAYLQRCGHRRIAFLRLIRDWRIRFEDAPAVPQPEGMPCAHQAGKAPVQPDSGTPHYSSIDRYEGYARAMRQAGLTPDRQELHASSIDEQIAALGALFRSPDRPTALVLLGESETPLIFQAAAECGLRIPRDLSLASFSWGGPVRASVGLSCIRSDGIELAEATVDVLMKLIDNPTENIPAVKVHGRLIIDRTVAAIEGTVSS
jgi:LacI family transcriptional regulator